MKKYKLKFKKTISSVLVALFIINTTASAMDKIKVDIDHVNNNILIEGYSTDNKSNRIVALEVLSSGNNNSETTDLSYADRLEYMDEAISNANGKFTFLFKLSKNAKSDIYKYRLKEKNGAVCENTIIYLNPADVDDILKEFNKLSTEAQVKEFVSAKGLLIGVDLDSFNSLLTLGKQDLVYKYLFRDINSSSSQSAFTNLNEIKKVFDEYSILAAMNQESSSDKIGSILSTYQDILNIKSLTTYNLYNEKLSTTAKTVVWDAIKSIKPDSIEKLHDIFNEKSVLAAIETVNSWGDVRPILSTYIDLIGLDMDNYNMLKASNSDIRPAVDKKLEKVRFESFSKLKETFNYEVSNCLKQLASASNSSSSSGGGGGGGKVYKEMTIIPDASDLPTQTAKPIFEDVNESNWAKESIEYLYKKGIVNGKTQGRFEPNDNITREEFIKMLVVAFELLDTNAKTNFSDVNMSDWFNSYVASAYNLGLTTGITETEFGVGQNIIRQDMAVLAYRFALYKGINLPSIKESISFDDESAVAEYALNSVKTMQQSGIINGVDSKNFSPNQTANRAQASKIIFELIAIAQ